MRITWSPRVTGDERAEFERKVRDEGIEGYQIKAWVTGGTPASAPQENEYFPVLYSTGIPTALSVLGVDLNTEPNRGEAWSTRAMAFACVRCARRRTSP
jgi:hypothetical protein